jgi:menaquinone-specific isochorismate synthase
MTLRLVTRPLREFSDDDRNVNDIAGGDGTLFVREGVGFAGVGETARLALGDVPTFFAATHVDDAVEVPGSGGIALGWLPFPGGTSRNGVANTAGGTALVPRVLVAKPATGEPFVTFASGDEAAVRDALARADFAHRSALSPAGVTYSVSPGVAVEHYLAAVAAARDAVRRGDIVKAVIARDVLVESSAPIDVHALLRRLQVSFGSSYRYSIDGFVGASPELLVAREGDLVTSLPLAGTTPRTGDPSTDARLAAALRASEKNQLEHRVVIDMVHDTLLAWCSYLDWQPEPDVIAVANVQHLGTRIEGRLSRPYPHVLDLVRALSPTPALGGHPREAALRLIAEHEGMDRGRYGGAVGWCDRHGNGTWAVAIRCAELSPDRRRARLFAGGGIVADSDPLAELAETQAKFQAMLAAIVRP